MSWYAAGPDAQWFTTDDALGYYVTSTYNDLGQVIRQTGYGPSGSEEQVTELVYDEAGKLSHEITRSTGPDGLIGTVYDDVSYAVHKYDSEDMRV